MVVDGGDVSAELRRRRLGRQGLERRVATSTATTRLPASGNLELVSDDLLLLAALALVPAVGARSA